MTCEEFLSGYRDAMDRIDEVDLQIREAELRLEKVTANYEGARVAGGAGDSEAARAALGDLILKRDALGQAAQEKQAELKRFIGRIGGNNDTDKRNRRLLRLYYAEGYSWPEVQQLLAPLRRRRDGKAVMRKARVVSQTTLFRTRSEAMAAAELEFRRMNRNSF